MYDILIVLAIIGFMIAMFVVSWQKAVHKKETTDTFWKWLKTLKKKGDHKTASITDLPFEEVKNSNETVTSTNLTFKQMVMKAWSEWWAEKKLRRDKRRARKEQIQGQKDQFVRSMNEHKVRMSGIKEEERKAQIGRPPKPSIRKRLKGWGDAIEKVIADWWKERKERREEEKQEKREQRRIRREQEAETALTFGSTGHWLEKWFGVKTESKGAMNLLAIVDTIVIVVPWLVFVLLDLYNHSSGNTVVDDAKFNIWDTLCVAWVPLIIIASWTQIAPEQIGTIYFFGFPLFTVSPGPYLIIPGIFELDLDTNTNMVYLITSKKPDEVAEDLQNLPEGEREATNVLFMPEITTSTPQTADWGMTGTDQTQWDFTKFEKKQIAGDPTANPKVPPDPEHKEETLKPSMTVTVIKGNYPLYRRKVKGKNPKERAAEVGRQLLYMVLSKTNTEFKKRTYAMLKKLQTGSKLDDALERDVKDLVTGFGHGEHEGGLGLKLLDARVIALGASKSLHEAVSAAITEAFKIQTKAQIGEGNKLQKMQEALGEKAWYEEIGKGKAAALKALLQETEGKIDPTRFLELQAQITAYEAGKHTYVTSLIGGGMSASEASEKGFAKIAELIAQALKQGGKS